MGAPSVDAAIEAQGKAQVAKKPYKNQTGGWLGVVKLDHLGGQVGDSVEPYGIVYLTDDEAILTARAPKDPKNNPFELQNFAFTGEGGRVRSLQMRPLVLVANEEGLPANDRYVPGLDRAPDAVRAAREQTQAKIVEEDGRKIAQVVESPALMPSPVAAVPPSHSRPGPPAGGSVPAPPEADVEAEHRESWTEPPADYSPTPRRGALGGSDGPTPAPTDADPLQEGSPTVEGGPPQAPVMRTSPGTGVPMGPGIELPADGVERTVTLGGPDGPQEVKVSASVEAAPEEHAAYTPSGEETGAAETPVGDAPEGEFAQHEEVGSPDAPTATTEDDR